MTSVVATDRVLAAALGVNERTLRRWKAAGMPREPDGGIDVARVLAWADARRSESNARGGEARQDDAGPRRHPDVASTAAPARAELLDARRDELRLKTEERRLKLDELRGALIRRDDVSRLLAERLSYFDRRLAALFLGARADLARTNDPEVVDEILDGIRRKVLDESYGNRPGAA